MAFKGIFDGSVEIGQAREARNVQMAMQQRQIKAQIAMQQQQLQASTAQANADRALKQQQFQSGLSIDQQKIGLGQQAQTLEQQKFDSERELRTLQQTNAKQLLQKSQQDFEDDQAQRAAQTAFQQSAFGAVLTTAMLNTAAPVASISRFNAAMGIPDGAEGSMTAAYFDGTGGHYTMIGKDAKGNLGKVEHAVDPGSMIRLVHSLYGAKDAALLVQQYRQNKMENTKMTLATDAYLKAMDLQAAKDAAAAAKRDADAAKFNPALDKVRAAEQVRLEGVAALPTTLRDDAAVARAKAAKIAGVRAKDLRIDASQSPNGGASGAWDASGTGGQSSGSEPLPGWSGSFPTKHPFVKNEDDSQSNVRLGSYTFSGKDGEKTFAIPTMVGGKQLTDDEAVAEAKKHGLDKYPAFKTVDAAETWISANHGNVSETGEVRAKKPADKPSRFGGTEVGAKKTLSNGQTATYIGNGQWKVD